MASQNFYKFLILALHAIKQSKGGKLMKWVYLLSGFIIFTIIADFFGIPLVNIIKLLPLYGWVNIVLVVAILSLLLLLKGAHLLRKEESTSVRNLFDKQNLEWGNCVSDSIKISGIRWRGEQLFRLLIEKETVNIRFLEEWRSLIIHNAKCNVAEIPEASSQWPQWVTTCLSELNKCFPKSPTVGY
jgi:hypothetical protein